MRIVEVTVADNSRSLEAPALTREKWGSRVGVILAVAGSAVGLGNFLRFPGLAAIHGGGVFMIPYFVSLILVGIPLGWVEWTTGRYGGACGYNSAPGIFSVLWKNRVSKYFGVLALLIPVGIYTYYVYIEGWCLAYAWDYLSGRMATYGTDVQAYRSRFGQFVGAEANGFVLHGSVQESLVFMVIVFVLNFVLIYRGLTKGIEAFCKFAMPLLLLIGVVMLVRVLTLNTPDPTHPEANINNALGFMWNPKAEGGSIWRPLADPELWLAAAGQIFFTLSVGFGIILNYASYLRESDDVVLSGLTANATNEFCEVCLGGLITVPVAFLFLGAANLTKDVLDSSFSLGFMALPAVFARMPAGRVFGAMWFFMLFIAAITSSVSMLQPAIAFLEEGLGMGRRMSVTCLGMITAIGGLLVVYFSKDLLALDTMDFWVGTVCIFVLATIEIIVVGWIFGIPRTREESRRGAEMAVPSVFWFLIKYVSPVYMLVIFGLWCRRNIPRKIEAIRLMSDEDRGTTILMLAFIIVLLIFFALMVNLAGKRWRAQGRLSAREAASFTATSAARPIEDRP